MVLRRQSGHIVQGRVEGDYNDVYELICGDRGDPDLDYGEISPDLRQVRGPYPIAIGVVAYRSGTPTIPCT